MLLAQASSTASPALKATAAQEAADRVADSSEDMKRWLAPG